MRNTKYLRLFIAFIAVIGCVFLSLALTGCDDDPVTDCKNCGVCEICVPDTSCTDCGKYPCECPTDQPCADCGKHPCECPTDQPCAVCGKQPCECPTDQPCADCGKHPCECPTDQPCTDCGKQPCECPTGPQPCDICAKHPCECPEEDAILIRVGHPDEKITIDVNNLVFSGEDYEIIIIADGDFDYYHLYIKGWLYDQGTSNQFTVWTPDLGVGTHNVTVVYWKGHPNNGGIPYSKEIIIKIIELPAM